jgi:undecaprenyl-diphosphatase
MIAAGTVPAAVVGLLFDDWIESNLREAWMVALALIAAGGVMLVAERLASLTRRVASVRLIDAMLIGAAQACALFPGVSRSGATMSAGLVLGLRREDAARFAFLLGTPAFAGAAILKSVDFADASRAELLELAVGMSTSAVVGFLAIGWLLRFLRTRTLLPFVIYRFGLGILALIVLGLQGI